MPLNPTYEIVNTARLAQQPINLLIGLANEAFRLWSNVLAGSAELSVRIVIADTATGRASGGWSNGAAMGTFAGASVAIGAPAYELAYGVNLGGSQPDITLTFDPDYVLNELFLDTTPQTRNDIPVDRTDGLSVMLHEIGHALGFTGYYDEPTNSFSGNFKTQYDLRLAIVGGEVLFDGPNVRAFYGNAIPLTDMNYTHYGNSNAYPGTSNDPLTGLMNGVVYYRGYAYSIGELDLAFLADTGLGTIRNDILNAPLMIAMRGGLGNDIITGNALNNQLFGDEDNDILDGGSGADSLFGGSGNDTIYADISDLVVDGGTGVDTVIFSASGSYSGTFSGIEGLQFASGAAVVFTGSQFNAGFAANGTLSGNGTLTINMAVGTPEVYLQQFTVGGGANVSAAVNGSSSDDIIKGVLGASNTINGGDGFDFIRGGQFADVLNGSNGGDKIEGAGGADILTGGAGADQFRYQSANASGVGAAADRITDFVIGTDRLGFALIDADPVTPGDQAFSFIGTGAFGATGAAQIRYANSGGDLLVQADVNGDGIVDMEIILQGLAGQSLTGGDFVL